MMANRHSERAPAHDRQPVNRHTGRALAQDRHHEVDGAQRRRDAEQDVGHRVEIDIRTRIEGPRSERRVIEPSSIGRGPNREACVEHDARKQEQPVREGIQARKRHVARAKEQRLQKDTESGENRKCVPQDHSDPVHGEQLVVLLGREQVQLGAGQLETEDECLDAADDQEQEGGDDIANADFLMIHTRQPADDARLGLPQSVELVRNREVVTGP